MRISVRMFLDDFINPPLRDYVVFYLEKVEKTLKLPVHHVFIYDEVETMKVKEFSDFIVEKLTHKTEIIPVEKVRPQDHIWMNLLPKKPPFRKENLGDFVNLGGLPIYYFIDKIVIICNVNVEYHDQLKLSRMNEIMDMCYKDLAIGQPYKYPLDMDEKKPIPRKSEWLLNFTYEQIENEGSINLNEKRLIRIYPTPVKSINREFDVMKPKNVANDWAINMFSANKGAPQFCLMDFSSVDNNFKEYMAFFFGVDDNEEVVSEESDRNQRRIILDKKKEAMDELAKIKKQKSEMSKLDRTKCNMNQRTHDLENMIKEYNEALGLGGMSCGIKGVTKGYAFALKPKDLQCPIMETRAPVKQDRALSAATKKSSTQFGDFAF